MAFICHHCHTIHNTKEKYASCIVLCTCPNPRICPECNLAFATTLSLQYHRQVEHIQAFKCEECIIVFGQQQDKIRHIAAKHPADYACAQSMLALSRLG